MGTLLLYAGVCRCPGEPALFTFVAGPWSGCAAARPTACVGDRGRCPGRLAMTALVWMFVGLCGGAVLSLAREQHAEANCPQTQRVARAARLRSAGTTGSSSPDTARTRRRFSLLWEHEVTARAGRSGPVGSASRHRGSGHGGVAAGGLCGLRRWAEPPRRGRVRAAFHGPSPHPRAAFTGRRAARARPGSRGPAVLPWWGPLCRSSRT